jgi:hypothetical protein
MLQSFDSFFVEKTATEALGGRGELDLVRFFLGLLETVRSAFSMNTYF